MRLARQIAFLRSRLFIGMSVVSALALVLVARLPFVFVAVPTGVIVAFARRQGPTLLVSRAHAKFGRLLKAEDYARAHDVVAELCEAFSGSPQAAEQYRAVRASILCFEERHPEAVALIESLDRRLMAEAFVPWVENNLVWALAHAGRAKEAVAIGRSWLESTEPAPAGTLFGAQDLRAFQLGTLGAALIRDGRAAEGIGLLEQALARGGEPREQAIRAFYLGEGLRAEGREAEARVAYERAVKSDPKGTHARRAETRLTAQGTAPYR